MAAADRLLEVLDRLLKHRDVAADVTTGVLLLPGSLGGGARRLCDDAEGQRGRACGRKPSDSYGHRMNHLQTLRPAALIAGPRAMAAAVCAARRSCRSGLPGVTPLGG